MSEPSLPVYEPDYGQSIIDEDLYNKLRHLPRWQSWAEGIGSGVQLLEDQIFNILSGSLFDTAGGHQLEKWGAAVNEQRGGLTNDEYRNFIRAKILVGVCGGTGDEYIRIFDLLTAPNHGVQLQAKYPASFVITTYRDAPMREEVARRVVRMMEDAKADGIGMGLREAVLVHFGFDGDPRVRGFNVGVLARRLR